MAVAAALAMCLLSACVPDIGPVGTPNPSPDLGMRDTLVEDVRTAAAGTRIEFERILGDGWSYVAVLGPHSSNRTAELALDFPFDIEGMSPFNGANGGSVFVLGNNDGLVGWFPVFAAEFEPSCLNGMRFVAQDAVFWVARSGPVPVLWTTDIGC